VETVAKILLGLAGVLALTGAGLLLASRLGWSGKLPGDIVLKKGNVVFYAPLGLSILLSIVLTIAFNMFLRR